MLCLVSKNSECLISKINESLPFNVILHFYYKIYPYHFNKGLSYVYIYKKLIPLFKKKQLDSYRPGLFQPNEIMPGNWIDRNKANIYFINISIVVNNPTTYLRCHLISNRRRTTGHERVDNSRYLV